MENFIWASLSTITHEQPLRKLWEMSYSLEVQIQLCRLFWDRRLYIKWCIVGSLHNPVLQVQSVGHCDPLQDQGGMNAII